MNREDTLDYFYKKDVSEESFKHLKKAEALLKNNKDEYVHLFLENYKKLYEKIVETQKNSDKKMYFINTHIFRTSVLSREYLINISAYDENWYLDKDEISVAFEFKAFFNPLDELEEVLKTKVKPYVRTLTVADAVVAKQKELEKYLHFLIHITHKAVAESIKKEVFQEIKIGDFLNFYTGEYKNNFKEIYKINTTKKDQEGLRSFFENTPNDKRPQQKLMVSDFTSLNFEALDMRFYNLSYANFEKSVLVGSDISGCALVGTNFSNTSLEHLTMDGCLINDASFENADLTNASLQNCIGDLDELTLEKPFIVGLYGVNFKGANLTKTNFANSDLSCADFTNATFYETDFTNANLENATFDRKSVDPLNLTSQQRNSIKLI